MELIETKGGMAMSLFISTTVLITLCLWTEYGLKQWFEPVFALNPPGYTLYLGYRITHGAVLALLLFFAYRPSWWFLPIILLTCSLGSTELLITPVQGLMQKQYGIRCRWLYFLPMLGIVLLGLILGPTAKLQLSFTMEQLLDGTGALAVLYLCTYILLAQPANFVIRWLVDKADDLLLPEMVPQSILERAGQLEMAATSESRGLNTLQAGRVIGVLERWIICTLVLVSQYGLIGLVLTAKSVARFKQIQEEATFAEYYLMGTLYSTLIALVAGILVSGFGSR
ncbi:MAG TPA: hypothetical protein GXX57_04055 [Firmicutes bacterium]|nr:hypothetical protein [Bacillota bacterium]